MKPSTKKKKKIQVTWQIVIFALLLIAAICIHYFRFDDSRTKAAITCDTTIDASVSSANGTGNFSSVKPGDTVCIAAGSRGALKLENFQGLPNSPITFINYGGVVEINSAEYAGVHFVNSRHVRLTGTGISEQCGSNYTENEQQCGIRVTGNAGRGVTARDKPGHTEVDHVEVKSTSESGMGSQEDNLPRGQWTLEHLNYHHNYIHDTTIDEGSEGIYIGESGYTSGGTGPEAKHITVSHNLVVNTGWDGIQVGSAVEDCTIHDNIIIRDSQSMRDGQMSGIMVNPGSVCHVYNNQIRDGKGVGIYVQGHGGNKIYNNVVVRSGGHGIRFGTGSNPGNDMFAFHNTIVEAGEDGIAFSYEGGTANLVQNNLVVASAGLSVDAGSNVRLSSNTEVTSVEAAGFSNPNGNDYSITAQSPAKDSGLNLENQGIITDILGKSRPFGNGYDTGAYEFGSNSTAGPTSTPSTTQNTVVAITSHSKEGVSLLPSQGETTFTATANSPTGIASITFYIDNQEFARCSNTTTCQGLLPLSSISAGRHDIAVKAVDKAQTPNTVTTSAAVWKWGGILLFLEYLLQLF